MDDPSMPEGPRYEDDFYAWTQYQAEVLRSLPVGDNRFDREHVAEELEDLGKSERDAVESQIARAIEHLLKLGFSPAAPPRYGWMGSVADARRILRQKLTPTLHRFVEQRLAQIYQDGREAAQFAMRDHGEHEAASALPGHCPFTLEQILDRSWYPDMLQDSNPQPST